MGERVSAQAPPALDPRAWTHARAYEPVHDPAASVVVCTRADKATGDELRRPHVIAVIARPPGIRRRASREQRCGERDPRASGPLFP
jgi:hypothetical protein